MAVILCSGMIRSGSTLQYQIISELVDSHQLGHRIGFCDGQSLPQIQAKAGSIEGLAVIKTHEFFPEFLPWLQDERTRVFHTFRDLRAVALSIMRKWQVPFAQVCGQNGLLDKALASSSCWTACPRLCVSRYEDLVESLPLEIQKWADALDLKLTSLQAGKLAAKYSIPEQRERIRQALIPPQNAAAGARDEFDPESLLHRNHILDGSLEGWRKELNAEQLAVLEYRFSGWLKEHGYALTTAAS